MGVVLQTGDKKKSCGMTSIHPVAASPPRPPERQTSALFAIILTIQVQVCFERGLSSPTDPRQEFLVLYSSILRRGIVALGTASGLALAAGAGVAHGAPVSPRPPEPTCVSLGTVTVAGVSSCSVAAGESLVVTFKAGNGGIGGFGGNGGAGGAYFGGFPGGTGGAGGAGGLGGVGGKGQCTFVNTTAETVSVVFTVGANGTAGTAGANGIAGLDGTGFNPSGLPGTAGLDGGDGSYGQTTAFFTLCGMTGGAGGLGGKAGAGGTAGSDTLPGTNGNAGVPGLAGSNGSTYGALPITELPTNSSEYPFIQFSSSLPPTGADTSVPALLGIGLVGGGFVLLATRRRLRAVR